MNLDPFFDPEIRIFGMLSDESLTEENMLFKYSKMMDFILKNKFNI
jgi:hypothetical protein